MTTGLINKIISETQKKLLELLNDDLEKVILFGSCARGDYTDESDIDIAVLLSCERQASAKYKSSLITLSAEMDLKNMVVVNFICIPYGEYMEKKGYYPFYANIEREGKVIYGKR